MPIRISPRRKSSVLSRQVRSRIERRRILQLTVKRPLAFIDDRRDDDLRNGIQVARRTVRTREAATGEPQLPARLRSGRYLERNASRGRGQLDGRAENRFPRCERQLHVEVEAVGAVERMRFDADVEVKVAVAAAVDAFPALARHA